jgi:hypothetical protein
MKKTSIPFIAASALLLIPLFAFGLAPAQAQTHWLVGRWDGVIEGMAAKQKPARTLRVHALEADNTAKARWAITGENTGSVDARVDGSQISFVVASSKSVVELTREGDDSLAGSIKFANGKSFPVKLGRVKLSNTFDGDWQGSATVLRGCGSATYTFGVKQSLITGGLRLTFAGYGAEPASFFDSDITGEIDSNGAAIIEISGRRNSSFSGSFTSTEFRGNDPTDSRGCSYDIVMKRR